MRTFLTIKNGLFILLTTFVFIQFNPDAKACIDPNTIITKTINYDAMLENVEIRLGNLKLGTENPNTFCTCALSSYSDVFTDLQYVAFVLPGTNTPYPNFAPWDANSAASDSWDNVTTNYPDWSAFVGEVINNGLTLNEDVELVIRAKLPPGYTLTILDSTFASTYLGTDKWDDVNQIVVDEHMGLRNLAITSFTTYLEKDDQYFADLDNDLMTSIHELPASVKNKLRVFPNPAAEYVNVEIPDDFRDMEIVIYNSIGQEIYRDIQKNDNNRVLRVPLNTKGIKPRNGLYYLTISSENQRLSQKFMLLQD